MFGNLQKGGDRREQVRHDFLDDRHERAAPRQFHELFVCCLLHSHGYSQATDYTDDTDLFLIARFAACAKSPAGGRRPVQISNWRSACATSISSPPIAGHPAVSAARTSDVGSGS